MTEPTRVARARCKDCRRSYRVPDPERTYTCKACGGEVRAAPPPGAPAGSGPAEVEVSPEELEARRNASSELKEGYRWMKAITWLYRLGAISYGAVTIVAVLALASPEVPLRPGILVVVLCTALTVTMLVGAIQLLFEPFVWTLVIAILATMVTAVHLIGPNPLGLAFVFSAVWALAFWASVAPTLRFRRMIAEHTDLYVTHHASHATRRALVGRSARERHERLVRAMRRAFRRAIKVSTLAGALIVVGSAVATWFVAAGLRQQDLSARILAFEQAWNERDLAAASELFQPHVREQRATWLAGITREHGWDEDWPRLADGREEEGEEGDLWVHYDLGAELTAAARWIPERRNWYLGRIELPDPPLASCVDRLLLAWNSSDAEALAMLYPSAHNDRMLASLQNSLDLRGWSRFPGIRATRQDEPRGGEAIVILELEGGHGEVTAVWLLGPDGTWGLNVLRFPEL